MRLRLLYLLVSVFTICSFLSCSKDGDIYVDRSNEENRIKIVVHSNTPDVPVRILAFSDVGYLNIKGHWEREFMTKAYMLIYHIKCDDETVLLTGEIYVNGKLRHKAEGNSEIVLNTDFIKQNKRKY